MKKRQFLSGALAMAALSACASSESRYYREAGSGVDIGEFGNSTLNNTQYLTGQKSYVTDLANRFAAEIPTTVTFEFNSAQIDAAAAQILTQQANFIRQFPEVRFRVYGHTDLVGSNAYNRRLGKRRANAVVRFMTARGISRSRLEAVVSFGETQPVIATENRERQNRRTVTEVTGFVQSHPQVLDGKYAQIVYRDYVASGQAISTLQEADVAIQ